MKKKNIQFYYNLPVMNKLVRSTDIVISSGGSFIWEFLYFGKPSLVINSNKIQLNNSKYLKNMKAIKLLDNKNINFTNLKSFLKENLLKKNFSIPKNFFRIVDGMGTIRLKKEILGF
jgi:spore coat polysaccharide biosynthesis predicted glycosyltransferase SpsG